MKKLSSFFLLLLWFCLSCKNEGGNNINTIDKVESFWHSSEKSTEYRSNEVLITLNEKPVEELLKEHTFRNDSVLEEYRISLSKNYYYTLKLQPDIKLVNRIPNVNEDDLIKNSFIVMCNDTIEAIDVAPLNDFGLSKSKQFLLVFPKESDAKDCNIKVNIGGLFNRFDRFEFQLDSE